MLCLVLSQNKNYCTTEFLVRSIGTIIRAITQFLHRHTDGIVGSTDVLRQLAHQGLTIVLIGVVLAVAVAVANPGFANAARCDTITKH